MLVDRFNLNQHSSEILLFFYFWKGFYNMDHVENHVFWPSKPRHACSEPQPRQIRRFAFNEQVNGGDTTVTSDMFLW